MSNENYLDMLGRQKGLIGVDLAGKDSEQSIEVRIIECNHCQKPNQTTSDDKVLECYRCGAPLPVIDNTPSNEELDNLREDGQEKLRYWADNPVRLEHFMRKIPVTDGALAVFDDDFENEVCRKFGEAASKSLDEMAMNLMCPEPEIPESIPLALREEEFSFWEAFMNIITEGSEMVIDNIFWIVPVVILLGLIFEYFTK